MTNKEILALAGPNTRRLDLKGKTLLPGIIDTHAHLFDYAAGNWLEDLESLEPHLSQLRQIPVTIKSVEEAAAALKKVAEGSQPGNFIHVNLEPASIAEEFGKKTWLKEMDEIAPKNPMIVQLHGNNRRANSLVFKMFTEYYGELPDDIPADKQGRPTGYIGPLRTLIGEIMVKKPQTLATIYKKELQAWAAHGITTWSSSLPSAKIFTGFNMLDRAAELPIRFAYSHRMGAVGFPHPEGFYQRMGDLAGHGTDYLWMIGASVSSTDKDYPRHCTTVSAPEHIKAREFCETETQFRIMHAEVKAGQRISGVHVFGDAVVDRFLDTVEKASAEAGFTLDEVRAKSHVIDHCGMSPRPDQIERAKKLNIIWSCAPRYIELAEDISRSYGEKYAHELNVPIQSILRAGGRVAGETDDRGIHRKPGGIFAHISYAVTRRDSHGKTWGPRQAVDKQTALKMFTRWAAEYVMREKVLGSLEAGKWADFFIIDRDYLKVPDEELSKINVLLTAVGGKIVYTDRQFARSESLPAVGLKLGAKR